MLTYIIKRIFLMIPTFLSISLIVFAIVNFAPGNPGARQIGSEGGQQANTGEQRESYRIFKEQFNLDKPVILNSRFSLSQSEVEKIMTKVLNKDGSVEIGVRIESQEVLENWGRYAVPALMDILLNHNDESMQALASQRLTINARQRLKGEFRKNLTKEQKEENKVIADEINSFKGKYFVVGEMEGGMSKEDATVFWTEWYERNKQMWEYSLGDKMSILIFDTRFAKYWSNLFRLNFGVSHLDKRPVLQKVLSKLKYSLSLAVTSVFLAYLISFAVIPQIIPSFVANNLYILDRNIRMATMLGIVGAGGIGYELQSAFRMFEYPKVSAIIIIIFITIFLIDNLSSFIRSKIK